MSDINNNQTKFPKHFFKKTHHMRFIEWKKKLFKEEVDLLYYIIFNYTEMYKCN